MDIYREVRCPSCGRLLCKVCGEGSKIEIKCKCHRLVVTDGNEPSAASPKAATRELMKQI